MKYVYFVSYNGKNNEIYGRFQLTRNKEITDLEDIEGIEKDFYYENNDKILITNYILMRKEEE